MKRVALVLGLVVTLVPVDSILARGRGGGGMSRGGGGMSRGGGGGMSRGGGGMSRPAVHAPSMSRPAARPSMPSARPSMPAHRPNVSRPSMPSRPSIPNVNRPTTRPNLPTTRPNVPSTRPNLPTTRPNLPTTRPGNGNRPNLPTTRPGNGNRPNLPTTRPGNGNRPNLPTTRPNLPAQRPGSGNRPNLPGAGTRPSPGDVGDFLDLPGRPGGNRPNINLPQTRPNIDLPSNRPNINRPGDGRPNINRPDVNRPQVNRPQLNQTDMRNRIQGGNNVNIGKIDVNVRNNNINNVRNRWTNVNNRPFGKNFWVDPGYGRPAYGRPGASWRWQAGWGRYPNHWCWRPCTWAAYGTWFAWTWPRPIQYNYGSTVVYRDNNVYMNEQPVATTQEYYTQAAGIAESVPAEVEPEKVEWMPLGVFALTDAEANDTGMLLQLAVSKEGIIAGTFWNETMETGRPVEGMVDRESQRAAWHFADKEDTSLVMEAGVYDLTQDEAAALIHFDQDSTQNWLLVRLPEPEDDQQ